MTVILIILSVTLFLLGMLIWVLSSPSANSNQTVSGTSHREPPPLPGRSAHPVQAGPSGRTSRTGAIRPTLPPPLPAHRTQNQNTQLRRIYDYPKCPRDRKQNIIGQPQQIFWLPKENCYCCTKGHRFK